MFSYGVRLVSMAVSVITLIGSPVFPVGATVVPAPPLAAAVVAPPLDAAVVVAPPLAAAVVAALEAAVVAAEPLLLSLPQATMTIAPAISTASTPPRRRSLDPALIFCVPPCGPLQARSRADPHTGGSRPRHVEQRGISATGLGSHA